MTCRLAAGFALLICVCGFGLAATINNFALVDAVNAKLSADDQFGQLGWYPTKTLRLHREYRRLYPDGRLLLRGGILGAVMLLSLAMAALLFGLPLLGVALVAIVGALSLWYFYFRK